MARLGYDKNGNIVGISTYDVARAIGASSLDVGTLCEHSNINYCSRFKPIALGADDDTPKEIDITVQKNNVYGLTIPYLLLPEVLGDDSRPSSITWDENTNNVKWVYNKPKDGINWHRLTDFHGYEHNQIPLVKYSFEPIDGTWQTVKFTFNQDSSSSPAEGNGNLVPSNIHPHKWTSTEINTGKTFADMYIGIALYNQREDDDTIGDFVMATTSDKIVGTNTTVELGFSTKSLLGTVYFLIFFSPQKIENTTVLPQTLSVYPIVDGYGSKFYYDYFIGQVLFGTENNEYYEIDTSTNKTNGVDIYGYGGIGESDTLEVDYNGIPETAGFIILQFDQYGASGHVYTTITGTDVVHNRDFDNYPQRRVTFMDYISEDSPDALNNNPVFNAPAGNDDLIFPLFDGLWDVDNGAYPLVWKVATDGTRSLYLWDNVNEKKLGTDILNLNGDYYPIGDGTGEYVIDKLEISNVIGSDGSITDVKCLLSLRKNNGTVLNPDWIDLRLAYTVNSADKGQFRIGYVDNSGDLPNYVFGKPIGMTHGKTDETKYLMVSISVDNPS